MTKPKVFIGSSTEGLKYARAVQDSLKDCSSSAVWDQVDKKLNTSFLEFIIESLDNYDFGIFIFVPDDKTRIRGDEKLVVRDNVIFEHGLFTGKLGRDRSFFITPNNYEEMHIPSDLQRLITATFDIKEAEEGLKPALATACNLIRAEIERTGSKISKTEKVVSTFGTITELDQPITTCKEDIEIKQRASLIPEEISWQDDTSDLNYLLLSVTNCCKTREIIKEIHQKLSTEEFSSFRLAGMYDIMGKWDLLVRFRLNQQANFIKLINLIEKELESRGQIQQKSNSRPVSLDRVNVLQEVLSVNNINIGNKPEVIRRVRLNSTLDYEKRRCQKAFIHMNLPSTHQEKNNLLNNLRVELERNRNEESIIEAISYADSVIIFEIFMRCSQTHLINRLNRVIENVIAQYRVEKYTLLCFEYDEC